MMGVVDDRLARICASLGDDRERTLARIAALSHDFSSIVDAARDTATDDEHDPEGATVAFERSQVSTLLAAAKEHLAEVDSALIRVGDGSYGRCERCAQPVPQQRLEARPTARTCVRC